MSTEKLINKLSKESLKSVKPINIPMQLLFWFLTALVTTFINFKIFSISLTDFATSSYKLFELGIMILLSILSAASALTSAVPAKSGKLQRWLPIFTLVFWIGLIAVSSFDFFKFETGERMLAQVNSYCFRGTIMMSIIPTAVLFFLIKQAAPTRLAWSGIFAALGGAGVGAISMQLHCSLVSGPHLLIAHILPVVIIMCAGVYLGRLLLRW